MAAQPSEPATYVGAAPPFRASTPKTTRWAGGFFAWSKSVGTTWHSEQAIGGIKAEAAVGFMWPRCAPMAVGDAPVVVTGGVERKFTSVPARFAARVASPWHPMQPRSATSARVFMWPPDGMMAPVPSTVVGWQEAQEIADESVTGG